MRGRLYILEGPDCCGKSTLGKFMAQQLDATYWHCTYSPKLEEGMYDYHLNVLDNVRWMIENQGYHVVLDRLWISNLIYGKITRPDSRAHYDHNVVEGLCELLGAKYVFCISEAGRDLHKQLRDPDHPYDDTTYDRIFAGYQEFYETFTGDRALYDFAEMGSELRAFVQVLHG